MDTDPLVRDYLGRLQAAAWPLSADRRSELVGEVREHIESALGSAGRRDEVTVRNILERLGPPEEIVAAEVDGEPVAAQPMLAPGAAQAAAPEARPSPWGALEVIAIILLTAGAVLLPFVGPIMGLVLVWLSTRWTTREKAIATVIVLVLLILPLLLLFAVDVPSVGYPLGGGAP
jgi:uncharacterized membrane protein